ncbi:hypothetical protein BTO16_08495 [Polaribacter glomeratus]|uniref:Uncharacterized protein n=2 Tax=Polaribacter glomeratus TaxID=102 RepID=A0A2S7X038_9FLAO|nr:hypothetical protein BTO16_08495 [Polaribacter glomeratus]TXD65044.1 DNA repair protein [Polaribacter glomeratus]
MLKHFEYKKYKGSIEFSKVDNCFYGRIVNIIDLVNYEAKSVSDLKKYFIEAVKSYSEQIK